MSCNFYAQLYPHDYLCLAEKAYPQAQKKRIKLLDLSGGLVSSYITRAVYQHQPISPRTVSCIDVY